MSKIKKSEVLNLEKNLIEFKGNFYHNDGILLWKKIFYNSEKKYIRYYNNIFHFKKSQKLSLLLEVLLEHKNIPLTPSYIMSEIAKLDSKIFKPYILNKKSTHKTIIWKIISQWKIKSKFIFIFKYIKKDTSRKDLSYILKL